MDDRHLTLASAAAALAAMLACATCAARELTVTVADEHGRPLADAVVIVQGGASPSAPTAAPGTAVMRQVDKAFAPFVLVVQSGTRVVFPNDDPFLHHVYSFAPTKSFDLKLYDRKQTPEVLFEQPGVVAIGCNIHDSMRGYIVVTDSPWSAVTGADGRAHFADVGDGARAVEIWHHRQAARVPSRELDAQAPPVLDLTIELKPQPAPRLRSFEAGDY